MVQKRVKAAKLHIYYEVGGQDLRITDDQDEDLEGVEGLVGRRADHASAI